ncbi:MAG: hypothetical protein ACI9NQ_002055 [Paracoccaceae bacterium]|jgi:hypothetical protein
METRFLKVHGLWAAGLVGAFLLGSKSQTQKSTLVQDRGSNSSSRSERATGARSASVEGGISARTSSRNGHSAPETEDLLSQLFNASSFSVNGIETLSKEAFSDPNPVKRRLAFSKLLAGMTPENAAAMRDQLTALGAGGSEWRDFNYAWGALAGEDAFTNALSSDKRDLESLISGWAAVDPSGAIAMISNLPENLADQKGRLENGIVAGLADRDRDEAFNYVSTLAAEGRKDAPRLMEIVANEVIRKGGPEEASVWVAGLADGPLKGSAMNEVAERYVRNDPEAASQWIEKFATEDYAARAVREVGKEWAEKEPLAAVTWLDKLPEGEGQKAGLNSAFGDWEDKDPVAAGEYLMSMPSSSKRDSAIAGFAAGYAYQDPETAIAWARDISDPNLRNQSLTRVGEAFFRRSPEEAKAWLPESGLSPEAQTAIQQPRRRRR